MQLLIGVLLAIACMAYGPMSGETRAQSAIERANPFYDEDFLEGQAPDHYGVRRGALVSRTEFAALIARVQGDRRLVQRLREVQDQQISIYASTHFSIGPNLLMIDAAASVADILAHLDDESVHSAHYQQRTVDRIYHAVGMTQGSFIDFSEFEAFYDDRVLVNVRLRELIEEARDSGIRVYANDYFGVFSGRITIDITASDSRIIQFFETGE